MPEIDDNINKSTDRKTKINKQMAGGLCLKSDTNLQTLKQTKLINILAHSKPSYL